MNSYNLFCHFKLISSDSSNCSFEFIVLLQNFEVVTCLYFKTNFYNLFRHFKLTSPDSSSCSFQFDVLLEGWSNLPNSLPYSKELFGNDCTAEIVTIRTASYTDSFLISIVIFTVSS